MRMMNSSRQFLPRIIVGFLTLVNRVWHPARAAYIFVDCDRV
jgi:hypothetical protein